MTRKLFFKASSILFATFFFNVYPDIFVTEIINNTDEEIRIWSRQKEKYEILSSELLFTCKQIQTNFGECLVPRTKHTINNLIIPTVAANHSDDPQGDVVGLGITFNRVYTAIPNGYGAANPHFQAPIFKLRRQGDFITIVSDCGSIEKFNFFNANVLSCSKPQQPGFRGVAGEIISDRSTFSLEINQGSPPVKTQRGSAKMYSQDSLSVIFKRNNLSAEAIKSNISKDHPIAHISKFNNSTTSQGVTTVIISFNKIVTPFFVFNFLEHLNAVSIGKYLKAEVLTTGEHTLKCDFYTKLNQEDIQHALDYVNKLQLPQFKN